MLGSQVGTAISARKDGLRFLCQEAMQFYDRVVEKYPDFEGTRGRLAERAAQSR